MSVNMLTIHFIIFYKMIFNNARYPTDSNIMEIPMRQ